MGGDADEALGRDERHTVRRLERDLEEHMAKRKPRRLAHSLSVSRTAYRMALTYGVDPFCARVAGILHDWDKVLGFTEQLERARELGVDLGVEPALVTPLLHGITAARSLPARYPDLPACVWQAIERHTIGAKDMSDLDMVIFVADGIEPLRPANAGIDAVRSAVWREEPLDEVFWTSFSGGVSYVIDTERYLYPGTLEIYNALACARTKEKKNHGSHTP